jgi:DNA-binding cell septation regulator SpoVG
MNITDVKISLADSTDERLIGFACITIDDEFVIRDLRIIAGQRGQFVAMLSRKKSHSCLQCGTKNDRTSRFCSQCGHRMPIEQSDTDSRQFSDIVHPVTEECREHIEDVVLHALAAMTASQDSAQHSF